MVDNEYDRRAEDGVVPARYNLKETDSRNYKARTKQNVLDSDATLIITPSAELTGGSLLTRNLAMKGNRPCLHIHPDMDWLAEPHAFLCGVSTLNVGGHVRQVCSRVLSNSFPMF